MSVTELIDPLRRDTPDEVGEKIVRAWMARVEEHLYAIAEYGIRFAPGMCRCRVDPNLYAAICQHIGRFGAYEIARASSDIAPVNRLRWFAASGVVEVLADPSAADGGELTIALGRAPETTT